MKTFYHASPAHLAIGTILTGGRDGGMGYRHEAVCLTDCAAPHCTVLQAAVDGDWTVYEVRPISGLGYEPANDEWQADSAEVVRVAGSAVEMALYGAEGARLSTSDFGPYAGLYYSLATRD